MGMFILDALCRSIYAFAIPPVSLTPEGKTGNRVAFGSRIAASRDQGSNRTPNFSPDLERKSPDFRAFFLNREQECRNCTPFRYGKIRLTAACGALFQRVAKLTSARIMNTFIADSWAGWSAPGCVGNKVCPPSAKAAPHDSLEGRAMPLFEVETEGHIIITWAGDESVANLLVSDAYPSEKVLRMTKRPRDTWVISKSALGIEGHADVCHVARDCLSKASGDKVHAIRLYMHETGTDLERSRKVIESNMVMGW